MAKPPAELDKDDSGKLEPKLTILKKRNPEVFEWVKNLPRGKLTQFIYEVLDTYMENGYLLKGSWVHPTDDKAMQLLDSGRSKGSNNADNNADVIAQLNSIQQQLNYIIANMNQGGSNGLPNLLNALVGGMQNGFNQNQFPPPSHNQQTQGFQQNNQHPTTQSSEQPLSSTNQNNSEDVDSNSLVFTLDEPQTTPVVNQDNGSSENNNDLRSFASSGGFQIY